jgi:hypothetical protein
MNSNDADDPLPFIQLKAIRANVELFLSLKQNARRQVNAADRQTENGNATDDPCSDGAVPIFRGDLRFVGGKN